MPPTHVSRVTLCLPQHTDSSSPSQSPHPQSLRSHPTHGPEFWRWQGGQKNDDYLFSYI